MLRKGTCLPMRKQFWTQKSSTCLYEEKKKEERKMRRLYKDNEYSLNVILASLISRSQLKRMESTRKQNYPGKKRNIN